MKFCFQDFQFDCDKQVLTRNDQIYPLNNKLTQLLTLLLSESEKIHSKAEILDKVWPNRVVTDQVIFQNISYLRALFGDDAIKTFSKKGYQWQLPLEPVIEPNKSPLANSISSKTKVVYPLVTATLMVLVVTIWWMFSEHINNTEQLSTAFAKSSESGFLVNASANNLKLKMIDDLSHESIFDSPYHSWQQFSLTEDKWLLATKFYQVQGGVALRFHIQGAQRGWHDYIHASSYEQASAQLEQLLTLLASSNYFVLPSRHAATAELTLLLNDSPGNELLELQLVKQLFKLEDLDRAMALIDQQLADETSRLRQGILNLTKVTVALRNQNWLAAQQSVESAVEVFNQLGLVQLESAALFELSWLHLAHGEFRQGQQVLNQAASMARSSKESLQEVTAYIIQSFLALKSNQLELMYNQIDLAKELIFLHKLGEQHLAPVYYNLGWFEKSFQQARPHYQKLLELPFSPLYEDYFYGATESLLKGFLEKQEWQNAAQTIKAWQRPSFQALSQAHIAHAQNQVQAVHYAKRAFQQAQVDHHKIDALDAALLLLQYHALGLEAKNIAEFDGYIMQNATRRWRDQNKAALAALNRGEAIQQ